MAAKTMFDIIKKQNGEHFAKAIRAYDNGIFDIQNIDKIVKYAGRDAEPILQYLVSLKNIMITEQAVHMDPIELLSRAGYDAYVADTLKKQNAIKKYFAPGEELCTFRDQRRFETYHIINAVRKDVDQIRREDFKHPEREDKYGTSVISIQVLKTGGFISIKNRYNHTVSNSDNTFNSNPDNIILGLSDAIKHHFGVDFSAQHVRLPNHYTIMHGQIIRFDTERNNVYCAEDFYAKDGVIYEINKDSQIMLGDGMMLDLRNKEVRDITYNPGEHYDPETPRSKFIISINNELAGKKLQVTKNPLGGRDIVANGQVVLTVENGDLVGINLPNANGIYLINRKNLRGTLNFGNADTIIIYSSNLKSVDGIKLPKQIKRFDCAQIILPAIDLDFSTVSNTFSLSNSDLRSLKSITMPTNVLNIDIQGCRLPAIDLDLGGATQLIILAHMTLDEIKSIIMPTRIDQVDCRSTTFPAIDLDFSCVTQFLSLNGANISKAKSIKMPKKLMVADLTGATFPPVDLNLGDDISSSLYIKSTNMSACKSIKMPAHIRHLELSGSKLPAINLDLSGAEDLTLLNLDLSHLKSLRLPSLAKDRPIGKNVKLPDASKISYGPEPEDPQASIAERFNTATKKLKSDKPIQKTDNLITQEILNNQGSENE